MALPTFKIPTDERSRNMRAIRSFGNKSTERRLASLLRKYRVQGWRLHPREIVGRPDFVIGEKSVVVFVDGCFFHGCSYCGHIPKSNRAYWTAKIARNKIRDRAISKTLRDMGYQVIRIRECQLRTRPDRCLARITRALQSGKLPPSP
jgi:DNA mismatch endonuclease (patch repair protein)